MNLKSVVMTGALMILWWPGAAEESSVTGKWNATVQGQQGAVELVFDLKSEGEKLTGSVAVGRMPGTSIRDGRLDGDTIAFKLPFGGGPGGRPEMTIDYKGEVKGDEIRFTSSFLAAQGGRPIVTEFTARRAK